jgi:hypothetical protein
MNDFLTKNEIIDIWNTEIKTELLELFSNLKKNAFDDKGEVISGIKLQTICMKVFGIHEMAVTEHGIALLLNYPKSIAPRCVLGVSIKGQECGVPFTFYRLSYDKALSHWKSEIKDVALDGFGNSVQDLLIEEIEALEKLYKQDRLNI